MNNILLIHNDNVPSLESFNHRIKFDLISSDIDSYISNNILPQIQEHPADMIYIKDSLSLNYMDFYGLRVAFHIRLSQELGNTRFVPIVILSDLDGFVLNKFSDMGRILFTENIFIIPNKLKSIISLKDKQFDISNDVKAEHDFLNHIEIDPPEDSSNHSIANKWAIYKWSNFLNIHNSPTIQGNNEGISSTLYFKYLQALHHKKIVPQRNPIIKVPKNAGKILYIDDEWDKGWSSILHHLLSKNNNIDFSTFEYCYKDVNKFTLIKDIKKEVLNKNPDVVLLDLRLAKTDHDAIEDLDRLTGIKVLKMIKEINPGIQVIMMTATSQSIILEKLYDYGILGYIKKEHPDDLTITTKENVNKLVTLMDNGLERKYLKKIWSIQNELIELNMILNAEKKRDNLNTHITGKTINLYEFQENKLSEEFEKLLELKSTILMMYEILDSNIKKKFSYSVLTVFKCLELISDYYIKEESIYENNRPMRYALWKRNNQKISQNGNSSINNKLSNIFNKIFNEDKAEIDHNKNKIVCTRNAIIHPDNIKSNCENKVISEENLREEDILIWVKMLEKILKNMDIFEDH